MSSRLVLDLPFSTPKYVAGMDVSCSKRSSNGWAAVVILRFPDLTVVDESWVQGKLLFPYIPGLLSFRELPLLLQALEQLDIEPDVFLCDGQGIAHPKRLGLAAHLGILINKPTVGCAKKRLVGNHEEVGPSRGDHSVLFHKGEAVGVALRTRSNVKPIFVSPGYGISLNDAIQLVLACTKGFRIPEPLRAAHRLVTRLRKAQEGA